MLGQEELLLGQRFCGEQQAGEREGGLPAGRSPCWVPALEGALAHAP